MKNIDTLHFGNKNKKNWDKQPCVICGAIDKKGWHWTYKDKKVHRDCIIDEILKLKGKYL